ncbi:MAG: hypothetical protein U0929_10280 [Planctomycetaceae bacterium]
MRNRFCLVAGLLGLMLVSMAMAEEIVIKPKQSANTPPPAPTPRPGPVIPKAAPGKSDTAGLDTIVQVDILSPGILGDPSAQNWGKLFEELGLSVRIRNGREVTPGVTEKVRGSLRFVTASGLLDRKGELNFGSKIFQLDDRELLKQWIDELKVYGAQGTPEGQILWGMNKSQSEIVAAQMRKLLTVEVQNKRLDELVKALQDDADLPIRLAPSTEAWLQEAENNRPITRSVTGFSIGTGLAIALNDVGAGFRPVRTPAGKVEYQIMPLDQITDPWPMGWEPEDTTPRDQITPELFKMGVVGFDEAPLVDVLAAIQTESKTPIIVDHRKIQARKIDLKKITASSPQKRSAWAVVVTQCVRKVGLYNYYRQDEAGLGFLVIAPYEPKAVPLPK